MEKEQQLAFSARIQKYLYKPHDIPDDKVLSVSLSLSPPPLTIM
jgi:hypothetical protein